MQTQGQMKRILALTQAILLFILLGLNHVEAAATGNEIATRKVVHEMDIDNLIDDNIETIREVANDFDPFKLDDINFPVTSFIYMFLHAGWAQNLAQLERAGKCKIRYADKKLDIDLHLGWDDIEFDYDYELRLALYNRKGAMYSQMTKLDVHVGLQVDFRNYHITLKTLKLQDKGKINVKLEGNILDHIANVAIKAFTRVFSGTTLKTISDKMRMMILHRIDELNFNLGQIINGPQFTFFDLTQSIDDNDSQIMNNNIEDNNIN